MTSARLLLSILVVWCGLGSMLVVSVSDADAEGGWCGGDAVRDWICPLQGTVYAAGRTLRPELPVPINGRRLVTAALSSAKLSFRDIASCSMGESSVIVPGGVYRNSIFTQQRGSASCWSDRPSRARIGCGRTNRTDDCPIEMRATGSFLFTSETPSRAAASTVTVRRQRVQIVSCEGFVEVTVDTLGGPVRRKGSGAPGSRLVIEIVVNFRKVEKPWGYIIEESSRVTSVYEAPFVEECESSGVQEMEETVRP